MSSFEDFSLAKGTPPAWNISTAKMFGDAYAAPPEKIAVAAREVAPQAAQSAAAGSVHTVHHSWWDGAQLIVKDIGAGALDELEHRPWKLLAELGIGAAAAAAAIAIGPESLSGAGIAGAIGAATSLIGMRTDVSGWLHDAKVLLNQDSYSSAQVEQANKGLSTLGGGVMEATAGFAGGALASGVMTHLPQFGFKDGDGAIATRLGDSLTSETALLARKYEVRSSFHMPTSTVFGASKQFWLHGAQPSKSAHFHI